MVSSVYITVGNGNFHFQPAEFEAFRTMTDQKILAKIRKDFWQFRGENGLKALAAIKEHHAYRG